MWYITPLDPPDPCLDQTIYPAHLVDLQMMPSPQFPEMDP